MGTSVQNLLRFAIAAFAVIAAAAALNFVIDPLQIFRPARLYPASYTDDSRLQDAGLIRSQNFNTVLMGTSLAIHFRQSDIDRILGVRSLKLSMPGSNSREQSFVLAAALGRRPARVVWEIDDWIFSDAPDIDSNVYLPADLYRDNAMGIAGYLFSGAMARASLWTLAQSVLPRDSVAALNDALRVKFALSDIDDINSLPRSFNVEAVYNAEKARASFEHITDPVRRSYLAVGYSYDAMVRNFERDTVGLVAKNPDVKFDIYFPPYSILQFVAMRDASPATLQIVYDFTGYISRRLAALPNVRLHDFRAVKKVTHELNHYSDVIHHSPAIDLKVLSWLADGTYEINRAAPAAPLDQLKAQVDAYRVTEAR